MNGFLGWLYKTSVFMASLVVYVDPYIGLVVSLWLIWNLVNSATFYSIVLLFWGFPECETPMVSDFMWSFMLLCLRKWPMCSLLVVLPSVITMPPHTPLTKMGIHPIKNGSFMIRLRKDMNFTCSLGLDLLMWHYGHLTF